MDRALEAEAKALLRAARARLEELAEEEFAWMPKRGAEARAEPVAPQRTPARDASRAASAPIGEHASEARSEPQASEVNQEKGEAPNDALARVREHLGNCTRCPLHQGRTKIVFGDGNANAEIMFVGEGPGEQEDLSGIPFVGRAGELLTKIIQAMDEAKLVPGVSLSRESVYICNVLKCRPPENRNPLPHEIEACTPYLERQLEALQPRIICCLGKFAAELLVGVKGTIAGLRGKVYRYRGAKLIVTYHPAACLRNPAYKRPVWEDMQLLAREYLTD